MLQTHFSKAAVDFFDELVFAAAATMLMALEYGKFERSNRALGVSLQFKPSVREDFLWWLDVVKEDQAIFAANLVAPRIYLGGVQAAMDEEKLRARNICFALTVADEMVNVMRGVEKEEGSLGNAYFEEHAVIPVFDTEDDLLLVHFKDAIEFIDECLSDDGSKAILVHCAAGVSRSATIVLAYLMSKQGDAISLQNALARVREARDFVCPNDGFLDQLDIFQRAQGDFTRALEIYYEECNAEV